MDKLGPICRGAEDTALVLEAICGADGKDGAAVDVPFAWHAGAKAAGLRLGYFDARREGESAEPAHYAAALETFRKLGCALQPLEAPDVPVRDLMLILSVEAAAAFDELTRSDRDDELVRQTENAWPNAFRKARFVPAVEYIQAQRIRTVLMERMNAMLENVDAFIFTLSTPGMLLGTNLTGHPALPLPAGFTEAGEPQGVILGGKLFDEATLITLGRAFQGATDFHTRRPGPMV